MQKANSLKVYIKTLGCKVNSFDSQVLENQFRNQGYQISNSADQADIQVINSCSVTANAEREARYLLRRFKRENPKGMRVITGCYAQIHSASLVDMGEVDFVVPNEAKERLVPLLEEKIAGGDTIGKMAKDTTPVRENKQSQFKSSVVTFDEAVSDHTRAYLKVQDGCNGFCAYCQIPYARGASRSVPEEDVLREVRRLIAQGVPEIVMTGIHVGDYGRDLQEGEQGEETSPFVDLMAKIFAEPGLQQVRISSLEPSEVSDALLRLLKANEHIFCDHFHLPLQAGSDRILKLMRRTYNTNQYHEMIDLIRSYFPNAHISADVICGFPQEGDVEFDETAEFVTKLGLASLHVFPYSRRPNTLADKLPGHISPEEIKARVFKLRSLSAQFYKDYAKQFIGQVKTVLWEKQVDAQGRRHGKTRNYLAVCSSRYDNCEAGKISSVNLRGFIDEKTLLGS